MKSVHVPALALLLGLSIGAPVQAAEANPQTFTEAEQTLCQPDVFRLCNDFVPDEEQIAACMKAKRKQLSPDCRKVFEAHMKKSK